MAAPISSASGEDSWAMLLPRFVQNQARFFLAVPEQKPERIDLIQVFELVHVTQMTACHVLGKSLVVNDFNK